MVGEAWYEAGEIHRLRGEVTAAEDAYRTANTCGRQPEPGLALLRAAQGRTDAAVATVQRLCDEGPARVDRPAVLAAYVEVMAHAGRTDRAQGAAEELRQHASELGVALLSVLADEAVGTCLAADDPGAAVAHLRRAWRGWEELGMPYEAARTRVRIGRCLADMGDEDSAVLERDAARPTFERLGARPDLDALDHRGVSGPAGLTPRELQVLGLVASGLSNREVAAALVVSEKTVARHLANLYVKIGVSSRAAATAYAYEHGLAGR
jgi:DNA-binding NarL/FixJ family response regulator